MRYFRLTAMLALFSSMLVAGSALAQNSKAHKIDGVRPEVHGTIGWGFGVGGRIDIPIVPKGFLNSHQDELAISPGVDFFFYDFAHDDCHVHGRDYHCHGGGAGFVFGTLAVAQWNIYFDNWSFFPEAGITVAFGDNYLYHHHHHDPGFDDHIHVNVDFAGGVGARWHFNRRMALVMRALWPYGLQVGLTF